MPALYSLGQHSALQHTQQQLLQFLGIKDMEDEIPDTKRKQINCEICRHNINKLGWAKQLRSKKHTENDKGAEEVDEKQCRKCGFWRVLELYRGTKCYLCLGYMMWGVGEDDTKGKHDPHATNAIQQNRIE